MERLACRVPVTTNSVYISGIYALNITAPEDETGGDWHSDIFFWHKGIQQEPRVMLAGEGQPVNTNPLYSAYGVYEGKERLIKMGLLVPDSAVFIANHYRAILDMLFGSLLKFDAVYNLDGATDDWLDTPVQKRFLLDMASHMLDVFTGGKKAALAQWISKEQG